MARATDLTTRRVGTVRPKLRLVLRLGLVMGLVIGLLALTLICAWMGWQAHQKRMSTTGLNALAALPDRSVWLSVNQELWHLDALGRPLARLNVLDAGLPAAPRRLVATPDGSLLALVPGVPDIVAIDTTTGHLRRHLALQWPAGALPAPSGAAAIAGVADVAVDADGRIALAHTATQAVLLFDAHGRFLARTAPETLTRPTALWWDDGELWAADTEPHRLRRLSGTSLAIKQTVALSAKVSTRRTVRAIHHPRAGIDVHAPVATLIRLEPQGPVGLVTYEWADGMEIGQDIGPQGQPRDLAWIGETLLVLENLELRLLRFDVDRHGLGDFGDMTVQRWLEQAFKARERLRRAQWAWAGGAVLLLLAMLGVVSAWLRRPAPPPAREEDANRRALRWLDENPAWQAVQLEQENVRDTIELDGPQGGLWLILSNRRLVAFTVDGTHTLPRGAWHRTDVVDVSLTDAAQTARRCKRSRRKPACSLRIRLNDGTVLQGGAHSRDTAERMAAVLRLGMPATPPPAST